MQEIRKKACMAREVRGRVVAKKSRKQNATTNRQGVGWRKLRYREVSGWGKGAQELVNGDDQDGQRKTP